MLGAFEFAGDGTGYVEIDDSGGQTAADAVRFFKPGMTQTRSRSAVYYVHSDHLGTPQKLSDENGQVVWSAVYDPFGNAAVYGDVDGNGTDVTTNLRFPGQYWDSETALHYNYFRYYDPETGTYLRSDPKGLSGGLATFLYAAGAPLVLTDRMGLDTAGCDIGPFKRFETPCRLECCASHDECYRNYNCTAHSWWKPASACGQCNSNAVRCFLDCQSDPYKDDPTRPNYYCPKQGKYITIPSCEFPDIRVAEEKCRT
jgi:RHS repeat-associated protein